MNRCWIKSVTNNSYSYWLIFFYRSKIVTNKYLFNAKWTLKLLKRIVFLYSSGQIFEIVSKWVSLINCQVFYCKGYYLYWKPFGSKNGNMRDIILSVRQAYCIVFRVGWLLFSAIRWSQLGLALESVFTLSKMPSWWYISYNWTPHCTAPIG